MSIYRWTATIVATLSWTTLALPALAQEDGDPDYIPDDVVKDDEEKKSGWHPMLSLSANLALSGTKNVVGTEDGLLLSFTANFLGG